uniref:protein-tyrosine-phosphatase n=1 Tax=Amazona collaria TaxID=241587 RepID=A0A8B9GHX0_9PSIT
MAAELSAEEEQATKQFLEEINKWTGQYNVSPLSWNVAVKFLMARKFDVLRAIELFHSYRETRLKEGIVKLKPHEEPLRSELLSGKFTILSVRDPSGASIALFTAKLHHPSKSVQHVVLQALFYLLDRAVESFETQRNGLVFIYDMAGSQYTNFELDLSKKILNLLKGAFPARLKKVFIVGAPMWFRVPYSIISLLLKEKLRERVQMVKMSELKEHLPRECLPEYLGGSLRLDPLSWNWRFLPQQNGHPDPLDELILVPLAAPKDNGSVHVPGPKSVTLQELLDHVSHKQKRGIYEEYEDIRRRSPAGTFMCSLAPYNQEKNRYGDVPCLDQTRVKLAKPYSRPELTDYINASFMDGYKQRNAYIGTQGPLENTYGDFWRMVWEQNVLVIVMTTRLEEGGRRKCGQYWPLEKDTKVCFGVLTITNLGVENLSHYKKTILEIHSSEVRSAHWTSACRSCRMWARSTSTRRCCACGPSAPSASRPPSSITSVTPPSWSTPSARGSCSPTTAGPPPTRARRDTETHRTQGCQSHLCAHRDPAVCRQLPASSRHCPAATISTAVKLCLIDPSGGCHSLRAEDGAGRGSRSSPRCFCWVVGWLVAWGGGFSSLRVVFFFYLIYFFGGTI